MIPHRAFIRCTLAAALFSLVGSSPKDFDAFIRAEAAKWEPVLKEANIKVQ